MSEISNYERAILDRHVVVQQTLAIWNGVGFALVFSYAGALFTFLLEQPMGIRLAAFAAFALAYGAVLSGKTITGATLWQHVRELEYLKEQSGVSGMSQWIIDSSGSFGLFNRLFSQASSLIFILGLFLATLLAPGS